MKLSRDRKFSQVTLIPKLPGGGEFNGLGRVFNFKKARFGWQLLLWID
jgi:hypothetical protein